jgi:photosystem II stability/assembly factor-like uncharacterized protein
MYLQRTTKDPNIMRYTRIAKNTVLFCATLLINILPAFAASTEDAHPATSLGFREIGPAYPSGRISEFAVHPKSSAHWIVATSSGGLWETRNAGTSWASLFDQQPSYAIGAIALDPADPLTLWVGTGENNAQRSVAAGDGVYRSRDGGRSWSQLGLEKSAHIGRIWVNPSDGDHVLVAAQGPLWSSGGERGLYRTLDAGDSWERILHIDDDTGVNDMMIDPRDPDVIVAASYQRRRHVWTMINGGPGSAIHRSDDGGASWTRVSSGLPKGLMGRIGLAEAPSVPGRLYAIIEAADDERGVYRSDDFGQNWTKQSDYSPSAPFYYNEIFVDPENADRVYAVDTFTQVSEDGGKSFSRLGNSDRARHVDDHALWIDPADTQHLLIGGDGGIYESWDRGKTWRHIENLPIVQFYRIQPDNAWPFYNVCGGTQDNNSLCGPSRTTTVHGITNNDWWVVLGGDGYEAKIDPEDPNIVYTQYQYGGLARYDRRTQQRVYIAPVAPEGEDAYKFNWNTPLLISPHNRKRLYYASERLFRSDDRGDSWTVVSPDLSRQIDRNQLEVMGQLWSDNAIALHDSTSHYGSIIGLHESSLQEGLIYVGTDDGLIQVTDDGGENWRSVKSFPGVPDMSLVEDVHASAHDVDTAYAVIDNHKRGDFRPYVLKTTNRGSSWRLISSDLPESGTAHTITEDPVDPDVLFVGTEAGVFTTVDGGAHWQQLKSGLPPIAVRDLEIQAREHDLVVGTFGRGIYVLDDYSPLRTQAPTLEAAEATLFPIRDALRYIPGDKWGGGTKGNHGDSWWQADNPPFGALITYYLRDGYQKARERRRDAELTQMRDGEDTPFPDWDTLRQEDTEEDPRLVVTVRDAEGRQVRRFNAPADKGLHRVSWDLRYRPIGQSRLEAPPPADENARLTSGPLVAPGEYTVELHARVGGELRAIATPQTVVVEALVQSPEVSDEPAAVLAFQQRTAKLVEAVEAAGEVLDDLDAELKLLDAAFRDAPDAPESLRQELRQLGDQHAALALRLHGDRTRTSRNATAPRSIESRARRIIFMGWRSEAPIGGQQREQYAVAERQLRALLPELEALSGEVSVLRNQASQVAAPWTPGRLPILD